MLFKYLPFERVDVLRKLKIRFSPLQSLNDPFEKLPLFDVSLEQSELISKIEDQYEELWCNMSEDLKNKENREELEQAKSSVLNKMYRTLTPHNAGKEFMSLLSDDFGILSLSRTNTSLLMWAHYASEGKGFVLAFDDKHSFFRQHDMHGNETKPIPVIYSNKRRKVLLGENDFYQKIVCEKPLEWAYEEEVRVCRLLSKEGAIGKDKYDNDIVLSSLPIDTIKSVYIGYQANDKTRENIFSAIEDNGVNCSIYESTICTDEYRIIFNEIKDKK